MSKKKKKIDNRLEQLFDEIKSSEGSTPAKKAKKARRMQLKTTASLPPLPEGYLKTSAQKPSPTDGASQPDDQSAAVKSQISPRSILSTAFRTNSENWATLKIIDEQQTHTWGGEEQMLVKQVADQLSLALENARLFQETQLRAAELSVLNDLASRLSAQLNIEQVLQETYRGIARLMHARNFFIGLYDAENNEISYPINITDSAADREVITVPADEGVSGYVCKTKEPLLITSNMERWFEEHDVAAVGEIAKSWLGVPLLIGNEFLGLMAVQDYLKEDAYDEHDRDVLIAFAGQAAIAIQNARLFEETQKRADVMALLNRIVGIASSSLDFKRNLGTIVGELVKAFSLSDAGIGLLDDNGENLQVSAEYLEGRDNFTATESLIPFDLPIFQRLAQEKDAIVIKDVPETQLHPVIKRITDFRKTQTLTIIPILLGDHLIGAASLHISQKGRELTQEEINLAKTIISQVSIAIQNSRLFQQTKQSETEFRALFAAMEDVIIVYDREGRYVRIAETNPDYLLRPSDEMLGKTIQEVLPESLHQPFMEVIERTLETGESQELEYPLDIDGKRYWFDANVSKLSDEQVFWVARDITERKKSEEDIAKFKLGIDASTSAVFITDIDGNIIYTNPSFEKVYGFSKEEAIGQNPRIIKSGLIPKEQYEQFWQTLLNKNTVAGEITNKTKDGRLIPISGTNSPILDEDGNILGFLAVHTDITERKKAEEALQRRNEYLAASAEIGRLVTSTLDLEALFSRAVNLIVDRFGFYHAALFTIDESGFDAILQEATGDAGKEMKAKKHALAVGSKSIVGTATDTGEPVIVNNTALDPIHRPNPLLPETKAEAAIPLRVGDRIIGALDIQSTEINAFSQDDIAILQLLSDQIAVGIDNARSYNIAQEAVEEMQEVDRLKSQFLANMSHELRTPLNSIIGFARVILKGIDGPVTELQQQDLTAIFNSGQHLLGLINDILDLSRIEAGKMDLSFDEVNISDLITSVMSTATGLIKDKPLELRRDIPADLPMVRADAMRIRQVLINLLSNATKFSDTGEIIVKAYVEDFTDKPPAVMISVTDSGPGISQEDQQKLFQPFSQVDASLTRKVGGSGLGLSICSHIVQMHNGQIGVHSAPGKGSTFYFTIPVYQRDDSLTESPSKVILAIDDDPQVITLYERYLEPKGYQVIGLSDPSKAQERVQQLQPFAVTLDILMPGYDGWKVLTELKSNPETRNVPVVICSILEEEEKGFSLGAADYLMKPIDANDLVSALDRLNSDGSIREVLIIDDDPNDLRLFGRMLSEQGKYKPILAEGGQSGWKSITSRIPHAIVLDLFMPDMNGFTILEKLRDDPKYHDIPVIVVSSGELSKAQQNQLVELGQRMIRKNKLSETELVESIDHALQKVSQS